MDHDYTLLYAKRSAVWHTSLYWKIEAKRSQKTLRTLITILKGAYLDGIAQILPHHGWRPNQRYDNHYSTVELKICAPPEWLEMVGGNLESVYNT